MKNYKLGGHETAEKKKFLYGGGGPNWTEVTFKKGR
jgi:hypothetical protein